MPVRGSTAAASCLKRPSAFSGSGSTIPLALAGTSNTYPCGLSLSRKASSHDSQLPHGVTPPAQLIAVPARLRCRSEEHTYELQSLMRISYAVFCLKNKNTHNPTQTNHSGKYYTPQKHK